MARHARPDSPQHATCAPPRSPLREPPPALPGRGRRRGRGRRPSRPPSSAGAAARRSTSGPRRARTRAPPPPRGRRPPPGARPPPCGTRDRARRGEAPHGSHGASVSRRSGTRESGSTGMMRSAASGPATERAWRTASRSRARRIVAGSASSERWSPAGGPKPSARRRSTSVGEGSSASFWPEHEPHPARVGQRLAERHARAPGAALDQLGGEHDRAQRPAAPLAAGQQAVDQQLQAALELDARGRLGQLQPLLQPLGRRARDERRVLALREVARQRAGRAEAIGQRRARELGQRAERADPEALQRVGQHRDLRARQQQRDRQRRHVGGERRGGQRRDLRRAGRARGSAAANAAKRDGAAPRRGTDARRPCAAPARARRGQHALERAAVERLQPARAEPGACRAGRAPPRRRCPPARARGRPRRRRPRPGRARRAAASGSARAPPPAAARRAGRTPRRPRRPRR